MTAGSEASGPSGTTIRPQCSMARCARADRARESADFVVVRRRRSVVCSLLLSTAARDPGVRGPSEAQPEPACAL